MTSSSAPLRATRREWTGLAVLALPTLLLALDTSVLYLALPQLAADLGASGTQQLWITDIYGFLLAGFLVTMGALGDRIGRRRLLLIGAVLFGAASILAACSGSPETLIIARAVLGIAGATLMPSTLALITNMFRDPRQRTTALAVWVSCFMGGVAVGPVVGGALLENFWWGSAFLLGVPVMLLLVVVGPLLLPEYRDPAQAGPLDPLSVALSLAAILPVVHGLKDLAANGLRPEAAVAIVAGLALGAVFVRRQRVLAAPLLDLRLFAGRQVSAALTLGLLSGAVMGGVWLLINLYLQTVAELSPLHAGLWQLPAVLGMVVAGNLAPRLSRRFRPGAVITAGMALSAVGFAVLTQTPTADGLAVLIPAFVVIMIGVGVGLPLVQDLIIGAAPPERAGSASAMSETSGELGVALGVAALGSVGTAIYRSQFTLPPGVPEHLGQSAREGIVGAVITAPRLPAEIGAELLGNARAAFTSGLTTVAALSIVAFLALALVTATALRGVRSPGPAAPEQPDPIEPEPRATTMTTEQSSPVNISA
ncbi:MFS transporter [Nonomuraea sp. MG754425]|uniref:MFS transporter n=1 Tax=Nonomuraea sp. MG754425 TaxID=2570319 RepID=UPI001F02B673|nr:MFS transporter [Nonomuraea sp. MG754425]MCF6467946.1 MFS transporter [Nonomuraea sp. MG754425]